MMFLYGGMGTVWGIFWKNILAHARIGKMVE